jgi:hypothetical protein
MTPKPPRDRTGAQVSAHLVARKPPVKTRDRTDRTGRTGSARTCARVSRASTLYTRACNFSYARTYLCGLYALCAPMIYKEKREALPVRLAVRPVRSLYLSRLIRLGLR